MIENIELKLDGTIPITRKELFELVSSWGRKDEFSTNDDIEINNCDANEKYDLSNLDVSKIDDLSYIFRYSYYNGDLSKWDVSNCTILERTFSHSDFNNNSISNWLHTSKHSFGISFLDSKNSYNKQLLYFTKLASICKQIVFNSYFYLVSSVDDMEFMFYLSKFNGDISNWNISNVLNMVNTFNNCPFNGDISSWKFNENVDCFDIFCDNENFKDKYNINNYYPYQYSKNFLKWFERNREKIKEINQETKEEVLDFFSFNKNIKNDLSNS